MSMEKKYFLGKRFNKVVRFSYVITVIFCFYGAFIYDYLFPNVSGRAVMILYSVWGLASLALEKFLFGKASKKIYYVVSDKAFIVHGFGDSVKEYAYENITAVVWEKFSYYNPCPVKFLFEGINLELKINPCLDNPCEIAIEIIKRLPKKVKIEENLIEKLKMS